ncbi:MAG TPA: lysophospholipid acyltransferase family protein [Pyrinomonadaceae bacterium]|jgi:1-acyl-sn-glycerol-3-phosphate acyltransferase|nr:lysophospholipid acyltransferase family protein [Pyrinomonadaceae bacterium]
MIRRFITFILSLTLRIYFRRIEVTGIENIPAGSPTIFVVNHPNALIDPAFLLCFAPRRISFIAKAPLFRMPVIGYLVRALDCLPAYRRQDAGEDVSRNLETFAAARRLLARGIAIGIFPEGVSHDEPRLKPLKTGVSRIAIAAAAQPDGLNVHIVPAGLYYTEKTTFRSSALLHFAEPIVVTHTALEPDGTPPRAAVRELSAQIETALRDVMLHVEQEEALGLIGRAEKIFSADEVDDADEEQRLARSLELRKRFVAGYSFYRAHAPRRIDAIEARIARLESELESARLDPHDLSLPPTATETILRLLAQIAACFLLTPFALVGAVINYPAYRLAGYLSRRLGRDQDVLSTFKIFSAMLLFPLTWLVMALLIWKFAGWPAAIISLVGVSLCGYAAVKLFEEIDRFYGSFAALALFVLQRRSFVRMRAERSAIRQEIIALGEDARQADS